MLAAALLTRWLTPVQVPYVLGSLAAAIPTRFGEWREVKADVAQVNPDINQQETARDMNNPYDEVLMRTYANSRGETLLLALAYGVNQRQEVKIHRPDLCYVAQGFKLVGRNPVVLSNPEALRPVRAERLLFQAPGRTEAVSYWIRIGDLYSQSAWSTRYYIFKQGIKGRSLDGILVRVSQVVADRSQVNEQLFARQEAFIADLTQAMAPERRGLLLVAPKGDAYGQFTQARAGSGPGDPWR
jgi:EpsI family protein